jgi:tRNA (Thr-GGU) A37 N-methylase
VRAIRAIAPTGRKLAFLHSAKDRPNHVGVTTCRQLDANDAAPVLDIKFYVQECGPRKPVRQAAWSPELMASYFHPPK